MVYRGLSLLLAPSMAVSVIATTALAAPAETSVTSIQLESPVMKAGDLLPVEQTQHGSDVSPALAWSGLPEGTEELALLFEGPNEDYPTPWVHWLIYNLPASLDGLPEALPMHAVLSEPATVAGVVQGDTGWKSPGYRGPRPTREDHTYTFRLYALDTELGLEPGLDKRTLLVAMTGHILGTAELVVHARQQR